MFKDTFLYAQIMGFIALIISIISIAQKSRSKYIAYNAIQNIFSGIQYGFLNKYIAMFLCCLSVLRLIIYSKKSKMTKINNVLCLIVFVIINIFISLITFNVWYDIFPLIASTLVCFTVWQNKILIIRIGQIIAKFLWGVYAVFTLAYFAIIMDIIIIVWTIYVLVRTHRINIINYKI